MASPITWRNVQGPDIGAGLRPLALAQGTMNGAFDALTKVIDQRQAIDTGNWNQTKENNTQQYLDAVGALRTPEAIAAAQADGSLDALRQGFGAQINQAAVRGAADARTTSLYNQTNAANTFNDTLLARTEAPIRDAYKTASINGDMKTMDRLEAENPNIKDWASLREFADQRGQVAVDRGRALTKDTQQAITFEQQVEADKRARTAFTTSQAAAKLAAEKGGIELDGLKRNEKQALDEQAASEKLTQFASERQREHAELVPGLQKIADFMQIDLGADGLPDFSKYAPGTEKVFAEQVEKAGLLNGVQTDTQAAQYMRSKLIAEGHNAQTVDKAMKNASNLFGKAELSPETKSAMSNAMSVLDKQKELASQDNPLVNNDKNPYMTREEVIKQVDKLITGDGEWAKSNIREVVSRAMNQKVDIDGVKVSIPPSLVSMFLNEVKDVDSFVINDTDVKLVTRLNEYLRSPEFVQHYKNAEWVKNAYSTKAKEIEAEAYARDGISQRSVGTIVSGFKRAIDSRSK